MSAWTATYMIVEPRRQRLRKNSSKDAVGGRGVDAVAEAPRLVKGATSAIGTR
jgi:hypothetical protein